MSYQGILDINGADPLATRFDQILQTVCDPDVAIRINCYDVAGAEPSVVGPPGAFFWQFVIAVDDVWAANLKLAWGGSIPRRLALLVSGANFDEWGREALLGADSVLFFLRQRCHVRFQSAYRSHRSCFGHAPGLDHLRAKLVE